MAHRNITLTPVTLGMDVPAHYQLLLDALTQNRVREVLCCMHMFDTMLMASKPCQGLGGLTASACVVSHKLHS